MGEQMRSRTAAGGSVPGAKHEGANAPIERHRHADDPSVYVQSLEAYHGGCQCCDWTGPLRATQDEAWADANWHMQAPEALPADAQPSSTPRSIKKEGS